MRSIVMTIAEVTHCKGCANAVNVTLKEFLWLVAELYGLLSSPYSWTGHCFVILFIEPFCWAQTVVHMFTLCLHVSHN